MQKLKNLDTLRAFLSLAVGVFIAFSSHQIISLSALAIFTLIYGLRALFSSAENLPIALVGLVISALAFSNLTDGRHFVLFVAIWGFTQSAADLLKGDRLSAVLALVLGLLFVLVPLDIVSAIGFFGAYLVISGVHLGISAFPPSKK